MIYGMVLALVIVITGLLSFWLRRSKHRCREVITTKPTTQNELDGQAYCDDFICIMLTDGTTRSGLISQPKAKPCS